MSARPTFGVRISSRVATAAIAVFSLTVPTSAQGATWANAGASPQARYGHGAAYDSGRDRMVVFGGNTQGPVFSQSLLNDTWEHDGTAWIRRTPSVNPPTRVLPVMAYDPNRGISLMAGGLGAAPSTGGLFNRLDSWSWNGSSWSQGPDLPWVVSALFWHGGANAGLYAVVWPGSGIPPSALPHETYRFADSSWVYVGTAPSIESNRGAYVPSTGRYYALTGTGTAVAFDGTSWQPVGSASGGHPYPSSLTWDIGRNRFVGIGDGAANPSVTHFGQLTSPLQISWTSISNTNPFTGVVSPSVHSYSSLVYDSRRSRPVLFGGQGQGSAPSNELSSLQQTFAGPSWLQQSPVTQNPASRIYGEMAFDPNSDCMVLFGGMDYLGPRNDTWIFDGLGWLNQGPSAAVSPRLQPTIAHDPALGTILFGGGTIGTGGNTVFNDTYRFTNFAWVPATVNGAPPARQGHDMVRAWNRLVVFGGYNGTTLADTWSLNSNGLSMSWLPMLTLGSPGARQSHAMAFDPRRNCLVVFGGADANGQFLGDTWELTPAAFGFQWTQRTTANAPSRRWQHKMDYDPARGVVVLVGGYGNPQCGQYCASHMNDVWEFDGFDWRQRQPSTSLPAVHEGAGFAYDSNRQRFVLQGGGGSVPYPVPYPVDTWFYSAANDTFGSGMQGGNSLRLRCVDFPVAGRQTGFAIDTPYGYGWLSVVVAPAPGPGFPLGPGLLCGAGTAYAVPPTVIVDAMGFPGTTMFSLPAAMVGQGFVVQGISLEAGFCLNLSDPMAVTVHAP